MTRLLNRRESEEFIKEISDEEIIDGIFESGWWEGYDAGGAFAIFCIRKVLKELRNKGKIEKKIFNLIAKKLEKMMEEDIDKFTKEWIKNETISK